MLHPFSLTLILSFVSFLSIGQTQNYFIKFNNSASNKVISDLIGTSDKLSPDNFYCPFKSNSEILQKTFIAEGIVLSDLEMIDESLIDYIELEPEHHFFYTPNDLNVNQWNLSQISAELAWNETTGDNVLIAMVDDAVEISHSDLAANIYTNPGEIPFNGIDDDGNGYIDDVNGWDAADNDNDPTPPTNATPSYFSHGTHCAGISAAVTDNSVGISSIGFNSKIIPVKIGASSNGSLVGAYSGVDYAINSGAKIISMSWGGGSYSITYQNIFNYANSMGIVCIAAAGNNNSSTPMYPAAYNNVISVGATDQLDQKASFSNYGSTIDVMAPGVGIYSTVVQNGYDVKSGTSMACPLVSGLAALMIAKDPSITPSDLEACLKNSCDNIDAQNSSYLGAIGEGRINAYESLRCLKPITSDFISDMQFTCINTSVQYTDMSNNSPISWQWSFPGGTPAISTLQNPVVSYGTNGFYDVGLIVVNTNGSDTLLVNNYIEVGVPTAQLSGNNTILAGYSALLTVNFTGTAPWSFTYSDGSSSYTVNNVITNPYQISVTPTVTTTYSLTSLDDTSCSGTFSGNAVIDIVDVGGGNLCDSTYVSTYQKVFESSGEDIILSLTATSDGGAIILAKTTSFSQGDFDYLVIKLDVNFNVQWQKTYGNSGVDGFIKSKIIQDTDGNFLFASHANIGGNLSPQIVKLGPLGNVIWTKTISSNSQHYFRDIIQLSDGNYLCTGSACGVIASCDYLFSKFDINGNLLWSKVMGRGGNDHGAKLVEFDNGNIAVCGSVETSPSNREALIMMFDSNFNLIWNKSYIYSNQTDDFFQMTIKPNGNIIASGSSAGYSGAKDIILSEIDVNGNIIWSKNYGGSYVDRGGGVVALPDGTTLVSGVSEDGLGNFFTILYKVDGIGNIMWSKKYTSSIFLPIGQYDLIDTTTSGDIIVGGFIEQSGNDVDILFLKTDPCGNTYCGETDIILNSGSPNVSVVNISYTELTFGSTTPFTVLTQVAGLIDSNSCEISIPLPVCNINSAFDYQLNCTGELIQFIDLSNDSTGDIVYWEWYFGDGDSVVGIQNPSHMYASGGAYSVTLIVGSDSSSCFDTIVQSLTIPNSIWIEVPDVTICQNDSVILSSNILCGIAPYVVSWFPTIGLSDPNSLTPNASPSITTNYTVTITDNIGTTISTTVTVNVNSSCCVSFAEFSIPDEICLGESFTPFNTSSTTGSTTFTWDFGLDATPSTYIGQTPSSILYNNFGSYEIRFIVIDVCGTDSISHFIGVNPLPQLDIIEDTLMCEYDTLLLGNTAIGNLLYNWSPPLLVSDSLSSDPYYLDSIDTVLFLTVKDPFTGCNSVDSVFIDIFSLNLDLGEDSTICFGDSILLESNISQLTHLWSTGDVTSTINAIFGGTYWLEVWQEACSIRDSVDISIFQIGLELENDTTLCEFDTIQLNTNISNALYTWQDGSIDSILEITDSGFYWVSVELQNCIETDSISVELMKVPSVFLGFDTVICDTSTISLSALYSNATYVWSPGGETFSSIVVGEGDYSVVVTNQCGSDVDDVSIMSIGCNCEFEIPNVFSPNQDNANEYFRLLNMDEYCEFQQIQVYNRWGEKLFYSDEVLFSWDGRTNTGREVPEGTYFYIVKVNDEFYSGAFSLFR